MNLLLDKNITIDMKSLITIMKECNILANKIYQTYLDSNQLEMNKKKDKSPVTEADILISQLIETRLNALYPIPFINEENKETPYSIRQYYPYYWCIDPIDGTKEFIQKNGEFTINIGLVKNNKPILGIVGHPPKNTIYYAIYNKGAYKLENNITKRIFSNKSYIIPNIVCSRSHMNESTRKFLDNYPKYNMLSKGSSLKFLAIAEGLADIYPRLQGSMEWDTCASDIIVTEAGGRIIIEGLDYPLQYNKPNLLNPNFIVYNK